jgi:nucleoside phosphorylase
MSHKTDQLGVVCAMPEEATLLIDHFKLKKRATDKAIYTDPKLGLALMVPGIGAINAAMAVSRLHHNHRVRQILNVGLAGSLRQEQLPIGTVCVGSEVLFPGRAVPFDGYGYYTDPMSLNTDGTDDLMARFNLRLGRVLTTEHFVANGDVTQNMFARGDLVEMEAGGIAEACRNLRLPKPYVIKAISDCADRTAPTDFVENLRTAMVNTIPVVTAFVESFLNQK